MNDKNYEHLRDQVKFTGFGEGHESQLKENMAKGQPEFSLQHDAKLGNDDVSATLYFRKSNTQDNYFFNKYDLSVFRQSENEPLKQTFFIGYDNNITFKEGYNLLSERSVFKEMAKLIETGADGSKRLEPKGEKYNAWLKMDLSDKDGSGNFKIKQFHQGYGFDLQAVLSRHPIKELTSTEDKKRLTDSLQKGNRQPVTFVIDGKEEKRYIEAAPQFKSVNIYDSDMQRVGFKKNTSEKEGETQKQGEAEKTTSAKSTKQNARQETAQQPTRKKQGSSKRKGQSAS